MDRLRRSRRAVATSALCLLLLVTAACDNFAPLWETVECTDGWYGMVITPPPSAQIIQERCRSAFNPDYVLIFTMDAGDLEAFQAATPVTNWSADPSHLLDWLDEAERATRLLAGTFSNGAIAVDALIDMSDPDAYTVYYEATFVD